MLPIEERLIIEQLKLGNDKAYKYLYEHHYDEAGRLQSIAPQEKIGQG